jgi:hypothetical protein
VFRVNIVAHPGVYTPSNVNINIHKCLLFMKNVHILGGVYGLCALDGVHISLLLC